MEPMRIVLYSHDSVGLGHVRRNLALAHALNNQLPGLIGRPVTGILITGTALAPAFRLPEGWDWVLLPGVAKGSAGYLPRNLTLPMGELVPLRARLLQATLAGFSPHLVVVDRHATGVHGELETALRHARTAGPVRVVLGLREVLDSPAAALAEWARVGGPRVVKDLFDAIWVYGDPAVHDPVAAGEIPFALRKLIRYTGYLAEGRPSASGTSCMPGRYCMTTVGGGSDGYALARVAVATPVPDGLGHLVVAGPQMPAEQLNDLRQRARPGVKVVAAVDDIVFHIRHAGAVVAMGGYNTVCEIMSTACPGPDRAPHAVARRAADPGRVPRRGRVPGATRDWHADAGDPGGLAGRPARHHRGPPSCGAGRPDPGSAAGRRAAAAAGHYRAGPAIGTVPIRSPPNGPVPNNSARTKAMPQRA